MLKPNKVFFSVVLFTFSSFFILASEDKPNFLFILADDLGWGDPQCYGGNGIPTPGIDRLAREGVRFSQFYQGGSVCSPTRATLMTGMWPSDVSVFGHFSSHDKNAKRGMPDFLDPAAQTLPRILHNFGYKTVHVGKWHLGRPPGGDGTLKDYGFDESYWIDCNQDGRSLWSIKERPVASKVLVEKTMEVLEQSKDKPFYCQLWFNDPHAALAPSEEQMRPFRNKRTPEGFTTPREVYAATVAEMDRQIYRLLVKVDELGLTRNTIVVFSSDNGPEDIQISNAAWSGLGSAGPLRGRKRSLYEGGVRVPFIVRWPEGGIAGGKLNEKTVVSGADFLPTVCELAGASLPDKFLNSIRGQSVASAFKGDLELIRERPLMWEWRYKVFNHRWNCSPILAVRDGKWKLLFNPDGSRTELYAMDNDPFEEKNLAGENVAVVERLKKITLEWQTTLPESPFDEEAGQQPCKWPREYDEKTLSRDRNYLFNKSDKDNDGRMSREEYLSNFGPPGAEKRKTGIERFPKFDKNSDGWLSRMEFYLMGR